MAGSPDKQADNRGTETRWKPGQSGNPKGRPPKHESLTSLLKEELDQASPQDKEGRTWKELIVLATLRLAVAGNRTALREVWDRSDGKVTKQFEVTDNRIPLSLVDHLMAEVDAALEAGG